MPDNYINKGEARKLGQESKKVNLSKVTPGKSIGGDIYKNREKRLPEAKNTVWREADINYHRLQRECQITLFE
ncbi:ribonuclease domain-containing protein [Bacillus atrophaeus]|uniref:ribonuclease domain-containing protein n=1 Tax=Bacillus atrophaeus TaxID=1452 RepID=UPI0036F39FA0